MRVSSLFKSLRVLFAAAVLTASVSVVATVNADEVVWISCGSSAGNVVWRNVDGRWYSDPADDQLADMYCSASGGGRSITPLSIPSQ